MDERVAAWLEHLGLGTYRKAFQQHAISWDVLPDLTESNLESLGVVLGHRKQLLRAISQLSSTDADRAKSSEAAPRDVISEPQSFPLKRDQPERRLLTVLFCDLVDSTALFRRSDPEEVQEVVRQFLDACGQSIDRFHGYIAKYMGDGLLAYFGYPHAHEHDAERAVHAGLAILGAVKTLNESILDPELGIAARIGIATGHVVVGELIGQDTAIERPVVGQAPNLAARLQALAHSNQLVVDPSTKRLVGNEFAVADLGLFSLKGFDTPVHAWQVLGTRLSTSRFESYHASSLVDFVGRTAEITLVGSWHKAISGEGQAVLLCGEPGIGKSRLARRLTEYLANQQYQTLQLQGSPYHTNAVLYPVMTYLQKTAGLSTQDSPETQLNKLEALALKSGLENRDTVSLLAELLSIPSEPRYPPLKFAPEKRKELTLQALVNHVHRLGECCPALFLVEDAHWLDPTTLDFVTRIIDRLQPMRVLTVITSRPEFKPVWADYNYVTSLMLERLPRRQSEELVTAMTKGKALPIEILQAILEKTDGVPLYIEAMTTSVLGSGLLEEQAESFTLKARVNDLAIPDSLHALLVEQVDRSGQAKEIVQTGAVIGREFTYEMVHATTDVTENLLRDALNLLVCSGLIFQEGEGPLARYHFKHALIQEAARSTMSKKSRKALHLRIATTLESRFPERVKSEPELLAHHYEQAGFASPAMEYWHLAARRAMERSAHTEALNHFDRALNVLQDLPDGSERDKLEVQLLISRGSPLQTVKGYSSDEMHHNYRRAKELLGKNSDPTQQLHVIQGFWIFHLVRGQHDGARNFAEQLLALATLEQRSDLLVEAHVRTGTTYFYLGRFEDARTHLLTAISLFDPNQYHTHGFLYGPNPTIAARIHLARVVWILGEIEYAETLAQEAIRIATELDYPFTMAFALTTLSWHYSAAGNVERTRELAKESLHISTQYSFRLGLAYSTVSYGWVLGEQGQEAGLGKLRHGIDVIQAAHANLNLPFAWTSLAELYLRSGRIDKGLEAIEEARELTANGGELFWLAEMHRLKGELLLRHSEHSASAAEQSFHEALKIARDQHATMLELRAATSLARFWRQHHKLAEATRLLQAVCSRFDSRVDNRDLREARTVLQQLLV